LQLRDNVPDDDTDRSTQFVLNSLVERRSISKELYEELNAGYEFLSALDHNLRLTIGRTTRLPAGDLHTLDTIASRMGLDGPSTLLQELTIHRLNIRSAFETILKI
jgi:glutamine synthetase adenylyltransferase